jgi:hypothetical protein
MQHTRFLTLLTMLQLRGALCEFLVYCLFLWVGLAVKDAVCNGCVTRSLSVPLLKHFWKFACKILILIYLLTAFGLTPGHSITVHIYTQTVHITTRLTTLVGRLSGIRTQSGQTKINNELRKNYRLKGRVRAVPRLCELYPGICLTTEEKARKNLSQVDDV